MYNRDPNRPIPKKWKVALRFLKKRRKSKSDTIFIGIIIAAVVAIVIMINRDSSMMKTIYVRGFEAVQGADQRYYVEVLDKSHPRAMEVQDVDESDIKEWDGKKWLPVLDKNGHSIHLE